MLTRKPRPILEIGYRITGAESIRLSVVGLRSLEEGFIEDWAGRSDVDAVGKARLLAGYIAYSLYTSDGRAFLSPDEVMMLTSDEVFSLGMAVTEALTVISPSFVRSDVESWKRVLREGARNAFNLHDAVLMDDTSDILLGKEAYRVHHPERYYGIAPSELTDGQLMAFWAGVEAVKEIRGRTTG